MSNLQLGNSRWIAIGLAVFIMSCSEVTESEHASAGNKEVLTPLTVYKTATCGCCKKWVEHISEHGFKTDIINQRDLSAIKKSNGISPQYQSCHTAISPQGFVFEGHIPAKYIQQFLSEEHIDAIGLSVPGMPAGSPGMEVGDRFQPYNILLLKKDGTAEVYAQVRTKREQYDD